MAEPTTMIDQEFVKFFSTLGIGGILAAFMFLAYRKDVRQYTDLWKNVADQLMSVVKENTASNTKLVHLIEEQQKNMIRMSDIKLMIEKRIAEEGKEKT